MTKNQTWQGKKAPINLHDVHEPSTTHAFIHEDDGFHDTAESGSLKPTPD